MPWSRRARGVFLSIRLARRALGLILLATAFACGGEPVMPDDLPEQSGINITAFAAGTPISTIVVEVSAADIAPALLFNLTVDEVTGVASGLVRVPHGDARQFSLTAFDAAGAVTHEGQATMDVRPGQNPPLQINLGPRSGQVPVTVTFGSFSVIVTPAEASLEGPGATLQLVAQVTDANGQPVGDLSGLQWATSAPWVATVDAAGLVTAAAQGSASVVATYEGVAGLSAITVAGSPVVDADEDGFAADVDCDDTDSTVFPGSTEVADGKDNDCDGQVDETLADAIAFVATGDRSIYYIRQDGIGAVDPGPGFSVATGVDFSPDGSRVILAADGNLHAMNADGSNRQQLSTSGMDDDPAWSPDGTRIAFTRVDEFGIRHVWTINQDGTGASPLQQGRQPDWSPDGTRIAYAAEVGTTHFIYLMNADGSGPVPLYASTATSGEWDPAWSPDGTRVAFRWGCRDAATERCSLFDFPEIYIVNADGTGLFQLTDDQGFDNLEPAWSPDGTRIAYRQASASAPGGGLIWVRRADGLGLAQPYADPQVQGQQEPAWSPTSTIP